MGKETKAGFSLESSMGGGGGNGTYFPIEVK